jgi:hypothetical protein
MRTVGLWFVLVVGGLVLGPVLFVAAMVHDIYMDAVEWIRGKRSGGDGDSGSGEPSAQARRNG